MSLKSLLVDNSAGFTDQDWHIQVIIYLFY